MIRCGLLLLLSFPFFLKATKTTSDNGYTLFEVLTYKPRWGYDIFTCKVLNIKRTANREVNGYPPVKVVVEIEILKVHYGRITGKKYQVSMGFEYSDFYNSKKGDEWLIYSYDTNDSTTRIEPAQRSFLISDKTKSRYLHETSIINTIESFIQNKADTEFKYVDNKGIILVEGEFKKGILNGAWNYYSDEGILKTSAHFKNGIKANEWVTFLPTGSKQSEILYTDGKIISSTAYYEKHPGNRMFDQTIYPYQDSSRQIQLTRQYYPDGTLERQYQQAIFNGNAYYSHGFYYEYFPSGQLKVSGNYFCDDAYLQKECGEWTKYAEGGSIVEKKEYGPCK